MKLGIILEGKTPPDKRVPLSPLQCRIIEDTFDGVKVFVQPSPIRAFSDDEYRDLGIALRDDLSNCDVLLGVKEVPVSMLIPEKTYLFFSHTVKMQPYNAGLLKAILDKKISLVDYELLTDKEGRRLIGFGRYAGIVGCYNGFRLQGLLSGKYELKPGHQCADREEVERELRKIQLPREYRIALTGAGRVAGGAIEILQSAGIKPVSPADYLAGRFEYPVYTQLSVRDYYRKPDGSAFTSGEVYNFPERFEPAFLPYALCTDMYIPCHYWDGKAPSILAAEDFRHSNFRIKAIADISCDIHGPIASTLRASSIEKPFYGYDPISGKETETGAPGSVGIMAVDNLPCELPKDASEDFGDELISNIIPELLMPGGSSVIERARETDLKGNLTPRFEYLKAYAVAG